MQLATNRVRDSSLVGIVTTILVTTVVATAPLRCAYAYVDPNSVGPLYQFLFPMIVAITSAIAGFRRTIARLWNRLVATRTTSVQSESASSAAEPPTK